VIGERPIADLLHDILRNVQELIRAEVKLAKAEVRQEVRLASSSALPLAVGALSAVSAWMFLLWAGAYALGLVMPMWAGILIMAAVTGALAAVLLGQGLRRLKQVRPVPERTVATLKENLEWIKQSSK
jgi:hypothetical protein